MLRRSDSLWEEASEEAAKGALGWGERQEEADAAGAGLLPLQLRPAAEGGAQGRGHLQGQGQALAALRRMAQARAGQAGSLGGQSPWANFNDSELVPLIPNEVGCPSNGQQQNYWSHHDVRLLRTGNMQ